MAKRVKVEWLFHVTAMTFGCQYSTNERLTYKFVTVFIVTENRNELVTINRRISVNITDFQKTMSCITGLKVWNRKITGKEGSEARYLMP